MGRKTLKILSLQEYSKKRKKDRVEFLDYENCNHCEYYRKESSVCLAENKITKISAIMSCPVTKKILNNLNCQ